MTSREGKAMAGFPHHALERYLHRLVQAGNRVAICEPVTEAKTIKAEITRVLMKAGQPEDLEEVIESLAK